MTRRPPRIAPARIMRGPWVWVLLAGAFYATVTGVWMIRGLQNGRAFDAAAEGDVGTLESALHFGADPNRTCPEPPPGVTLDPDEEETEDPTIPRVTLLHEAVRGGSPACVVLLLRAGADPDRVGRGDARVARSLGADPGLRAALRTTAEGFRLLKDYGLR